ncbi:hypothetical protein BJY00DRAFT_278330 [Aspergillus carlsbadensis]|nr:hypothetical protein BJY00DRAFT_278330 [Aspergillus carlsbadensis]
MARCSTLHPLSAFLMNPIWHLLADIQQDWQNIGPPPCSSWIVPRVGEPLLHAETVRFLIFGLDGRWPGRCPFLRTLRWIEILALKHVSRAFFGTLNVIRVLQPQIRSTTIVLLYPTMGPFAKSLRPQNNMNTRALIGKMIQSTPSSTVNWRCQRLT